MSITLTKDILNKYDVAGPRYTSYPTAPEWSNDINALNYQDKLIEFGKTDKTLSLYVHIPFCESLCYFCACNKVIRAQDEKVGDEFLKHLFIELDLVAQSIGKRKTIRQLHWGGGTPSYLSIAQMTALFNKIKSLFDIDLSGEVAIEVDPRTVSLAKLEALKNLGFNRVSMGVQDFDEKVQDDINRIQPFEQVKALNDGCRRLNFKSVNFDLIYGLPYQTKATFNDTIRQVIDLRPDRIALYSFAYVPWLSKPQHKFNLDAIAKHDEKLEIFLQSRVSLLEAGYQSIAMDHFALADDEMAVAFNEGKLHRNFMGYTVKPADEYIGVGPSAIGFVENAYFQNVKVLPDYYAIIQSGKLPIERGSLLTQDDMIRRWVINQLMCHFQIDKNEFKRMMNIDFDQYFEVELKHIKECLEDGLIEVTSSSLVVTELGKVFVRNICMGFDWFLRQKNAHRRFSRTV